MTETAEGTDDAPIRFVLDGREVTARRGETIWQVARREGILIPHLCYRDAPDYRADGNCRACMVEIEGERTLAASCIRTPSEGMVVRVTSPRARAARKGVIELLLADQPDDRTPDRSAHLWRMAELAGARADAFPPSGAPGQIDDSHPAIHVDHGACIDCTLCLRACREVQHNDVIGMAARGFATRVSFDFDDPMGESTCVACGECVAVCPTGALMPATLVDAAGNGDRAAAPSLGRTVCAFCGVGCQIEAFGEGGRILAVEGVDGPANRGRLCVKGRFGFDYIHHPERLTKPLIRKPGAPKEMEVDPANPFSHFREATWEEALEVAAKGLARLRDEHGGEAVAGFGSAKCSNEEAYLFQRLIRQGFGHNHVDHCTRLCHASSVAALMENVGSGAVTATFNEIENADCAIVIGANPVENHPVAATFFKDFAARGGTLIVMDPRANGLFRHATFALQFRPGTDVALLNAIMHVIAEEELFDADYIARFTENWEAFRRHLAPFSPERMAPLTGTDAATIRVVARAFATAEAGMIFWGMGVSQHVHGTDNARCLISLALMCGHVGRPGTGLHPLRGQNNVQGASDAGLIPMVLPDYRSVSDDAARALAEEVWGLTPDSLSPEPGLTVVEIMDAIHEGRIRGMYVAGENPAMSDPDLTHARAALAKLDHLVVQDIFLTETAMFADVILPAAAAYEKAGTVTNTNRQVQMLRPLVPPPGDARPDWQIIVEMGRRLGLPWNFAHPREVFAEMKRLMPSLDNITWERVEREHAVTYPCPAPDHPGLSVVFSDGFPRPSGRARFTPAEVAPPAELPDADFPMILITGRQLEHWHTGAMTRRASVLDALEPGPVAALHPRTLARLGIRPGDRVRLVTRRGAVTAPTRADRAVPEDAAFLPFAYREAPANCLTNPALDPFGKIPEFKFSALRIEPVETMAAE